MEQICDHIWSEYEMDLHGQTVRMCADCGAKDYCTHEETALDEEGAYCTNCYYAVTEYPADFSGANGGDR